jgi:hypothetical protein
MDEVERRIQRVYGPVRCVLMHNYSTNSTVCMFGDVHMIKNECKDDGVNIVDYIKFQIYQALASADDDGPVDLYVENHADLVRPRETRESQKIQSALQYMESKYGTLIGIQRMLVQSIFPFITNSVYSQRISSHLKVHAADFRNKYIKFLEGNLMQAHDTEQSQKNIRQIYLQHINYILDFPEMRKLYNDCDTTAREQIKSFLTREQHAILDKNIELLEHRMILTNMIMLDLYILLDMFNANAPSRRSIIYAGDLHIQYYAKYLSSIGFETLHNNSNYKPNLTYVETEISSSPLCVYIPEIMKPLWRVKHGGIRTFDEVRLSPNVMPREIECAGAKPSDVASYITLQHASTPAALVLLDTYTRTMSRTCVGRTPEELDSLKMLIEHLAYRSKFKSVHVDINNVNFMNPFHRYILMQYIIHGYDTISFVAPRSFELSNQNDIEIEFKNLAFENNCNSRYTETYGNHIIDLLANYSTNNNRAKLAKLADVARRKLTHAEIEMCTRANIDDTATILKICDAVSNTNVVRNTREIRSILRTGRAESKQIAHAYQTILDLHDNDALISNLYDHMTQVIYRIRHMINTACKEQVVYNKQTVNLLTNIITETNLNHLLNRLVVGELAADAASLPHTP